MGVATSVAHTIGLHRNPEKANMDAKRTKLWKRIWWSTYMRDRLIALGMRRPTRIKSEDFDVPMLTLDDFEIAPFPETNSCLPPDCSMARDVDMQRKLAVMCIEKAKLCLNISLVLSKQYCVLNNAQGLSNDRTTMMLLPKKLDPETSEVKDCDEELQKWVNGLPEEAKYTDEPSGSNALDLHRSLLHMVFFTTLSALHRPQVLPSGHGGASTVTTPAATTPQGSEILDISRRNVRRAASAITAIAQRLDSQNLVQYLPTTGVTVLLPAIIIHLLDIKAPEEETRRASLRGFCQCMTVMGQLRELYAAADYSTAFLEAAIRKAGIQIAAPTPSQSTPAQVPGKPSPVNSVEDLVDAGRRLDNPASGLNGSAAAAVSRRLRRDTLTPPPDNGTTNLHSLEKRPGPNVTDEEVARRLETFLASTPPESDHDHEMELDHSSQHNGDDDMKYDHRDSHPAISISHGTTTTTHSKYQPSFMHTLPPNPFNHHQDDEMLFSALPMQHQFDEGNFDDLLNLDAVGETFSFNEGVAMDSGDLNDVEWLVGGAAERGLLPVAEEVH